MVMLISDTAAAMVYTNMSHSRQFEFFVIEKLIVHHKVANIVCYSLKFLFCDLAATGIGLLIFQYKVMDVWGVFLVFSVKSEMIGFSFI